MQLDFCKAEAVKGSSVLALHQLTLILHDNSGGFFPCAAILMVGLFFLKKERALFTFAMYQNIIICTKQHQG